jgi:hypothetical protein
MMSEDIEVRLFLLEESALQRDREIATLHAELFRQMEAIARLDRHSAPNPASAPVPRPPVPEPKRPLPALPPGCLDSLIVADFPAIFSEFRGKRFTLLWRGSRDGFLAKEFHGHCDGHANTLTFIEDTGGNIVGGFTRVEWESVEWNGKSGAEHNGWKADPTLQSFLFSLRNPHNFPSRRFALKASEKARAIDCDSAWGPCFSDIGVFDGCNANNENYAANFGYVYTIDTGLDGFTFFAGSTYFTVKEIEVFEITD